MVDKNNITLPLEWFLHWADVKPKDIFLRQPVNGHWNEFSWQDAAILAKNIAQNLSSMGFERGDRIAILSKNCAYWVVADIALQLGGFISVPLYTDQSEDNFKYILDNANCKAIFLGKLDKDLWLRYKSSLPTSVTKIFFPFMGSAGDCQKTLDLPKSYSWNDITFSDKVDGYDVNLPTSDDIWTILYTSGTSGVPKGVVHTYRGVASCRAALQTELELSERDRFFSYLPLAHAVERLLLETNALFFGISISFTESLDTFQDDLKSSQPTLFFSVPRIWKKLQLGILDKLSEAKLRFLLTLPIVNRLVAKKVRNQLGLSSARLILSGAAPISVSTLQWFKKLGIHILEGYALTENFSYGCVNTRLHNKIGSVGKPLPNSGFKLASNGEILFKSELVMQGYYLNDELTKDAFDEDGYFKTGDLGYVDSDGFVFIKGRTKEIFKTAKGEYVAPVSIENKLMAEHTCEQVCVMGAGLEQPMAIITSPALRDCDESKQYLETLLTKINASLLNHEKLSKIVIFPESWTPENGIMTPTLKVKRASLENKINTEYSHQLASADSVVFLSKPSM